MPAEREQRRLRILEIVAKQSLRTQDELAGALAKAGWPATQSSVSRDIAALGLVKIGGRYSRPPRPARANENQDAERIAEVVLSAESAGDALIVLKTPAGEANHVAVGLDRLAWPDVVGTIAGDDTIFVAVQNKAGKQRTMARLKRLKGA